MIRTRTVCLKGRMIRVDEKPARGSDDWYAEKLAPMFVKSDDPVPDPVINEYIP